MIFNRNRNRSRTNNQLRRQIVFPSRKSGEEQQVQALGSANSGYIIEPQAQTSPVQKGLTASINVRPSIMIVVVVAILLLFTASVLQSPDAPHIRDDMPQLLHEYGEYLKNKNPDKRSNQVAQVQRRLEALALYDNLGDKQEAKTILEELMLIDSDTNSPLYKYSVKLLQSFNN